MKKHCELYRQRFLSDWGFYLSWNRWGEETDFNSIDDYNNYLSRLKELPQVMDEYTTDITDEVNRWVVEQRKVTR